MAFWGFTGMLGSLIHPTAMAILIALWVTTFLIGLQVRKARLQPTEAATGLLSGVAGKGPKHHKLSAGLVFLTTLFCFIGMFNTYSRAGRLFPGQHLYEGLGVLLALSFNVMVVPWFKDTPNLRLLHTAVGLVILALLAGQIWSGWPILMSVFSL